MINKKIKELEFKLEEVRGELMGKLEDNHYNYHAIQDLSNEFVMLSVQIDCLIEFVED